MSSAYIKWFQMIWNLFFQTALLHPQLWILHYCTSYCPEQFYFTICFDIFCLWHINSMNTNKRKHQQLHSPNTTLFFWRNTLAFSRLWVVMFIEEMSCHHWSSRLRVYGWKLVSIYSYKVAFKITHLHWIWLILLSLSQGSWTWIWHWCTLHWTLYCNTAGGYGSLCFVSLLWLDIDL